MPRGWRQIALAVSLLAPLARAADRPLAGSKLLVQDPTGDPLRRKIVVKATDPGATTGLAGNPASAGADLRIVTQGGTSADQTFSLPASGWKLLGVIGFRYSNAVPGGAVKSVLLKRNARGLSLKLSVRGQVGPVDIVPPNPGDTATIVLVISGGDTYCTSFGGAAGGVERRDDAQRWLVGKS